MGAIAGMRSWQDYPPPGPWTVDAACATLGDGPNKWTDVTNEEQAGPAIVICQSCPVRAECLAYGRSIRAYGVWGGKYLRGPREIPLSQAS